MKEGGCQKYHLAKGKFTCAALKTVQANKGNGEPAAVQCGMFYSRDSSHRFVPLCFPALLLVAAAAPELHCAGGFFLGTGAFALPLKAFVGSSLFRCTSPVVSDEPASLLNISGWYSEAHCCKRQGRDRLLLLA